MGINKFNAGGYFDPTAFEAITKTVQEEKQNNNYSFRPIVYICSPYSGDVNLNIENTRRYCKFAVDNGYIPIAPHLLFTQFLNDKNLQDRNLGIFFGNVLMSKCAEIWVCGEIISVGMKSEIERATRKNYKIRYFDNDMKEVFN